MSKSKKEIEMLNGRSMNPQDIDLNKAAELFYEFIMGHPQILKLAEEELKKEKEKKSLEI